MPIFRRSLAGPKSESKIRRGIRIMNGIKSRIESKIRT